MQAIIEESREGYSTRLVDSMLTALRTAGVPSSELHRYEHVLSEVIIRFAHVKWGAYVRYLRALEVLECPASTSIDVDAGHQEAVERCISEIQQARRVYYSELDKIFDHMLGQWGGPERGRVAKLIADFPDYDQ